MDSFIGEKFYWDNGGVWTVLYDNGLTCNKKRYIMHCSLCSKDKMMWPEGSIFSAKCDVKRGRCSCECKDRKTKQTTGYQVLYRERFEV